MKPIKVKVLPQHIVDGKPFVPNCCPVALAVKEVSQSEEIEVTHTEVHIGSLRFDLPRRVTRFIKRFDNSRPVTPINFWLR